MQQPIQATMLVLTLAAAPAIAQSPAVNTHWSWTEVHANTTTPVANPNGILEPGESALLQMTVAFAPPVGSILPVPGYPEATVAGLASAGVILEGLRQSAGGWAFGEFSHASRRPEWALGGMGGQNPPGRARYEAISVGQFPLPGQTANPENPIEDVWRVVWTPSTYAPDTLLFASGWINHLGGSIWLQTGSDPTTGAPIYGWAFSVFTAPQPHVLIPIIPAPGGATLLGLAALGLLRRRSAAH